MTTDNDELIARFIVYMRSERAARDNTIDNYTRDLRRFAEWLSRPLSEATRTDLQTYSSSAIASGKSGSTAGRRLCCFRTFYHFLMDEDLVSADPTLNLRSPRTWKKIPKATGQLNVEKMIATRQFAARNSRQGNAAALFRVWFSPNRASGAQGC
jgi:integrase/recombinase XerD